MKTRSLAWILASFLLTLAAPVSAKLMIVTSIKPIYNLTEGVTRGVDEVELLVPANMSAHHYSLTPSQQEKLSRADVLIWIGPEMELFLEKSQQHLSSAATVITLLTAPHIKTLTVGEGEDEASIDPHIWLDPQNAIAMVQEIAQSLGKLAPANKARYDSNAADTQKKLQDLDQKLKAQTEPLRNRAFFSYHDGLHYFNVHYDLKQIDTVTDINDSPLGPKHLFNVHEELKDKSHICLFVEAGTPPKLIKTLLHKTKAEVAEVDDMGYNTPPTFDGYVLMMENLANTLSHCLLETS